jgi:hypothetical protein
VRSGASPGGERHSQEPFARRLVADGCEELGCYGAAALMERHADDLRDAYFILRSEPGFTFPEAPE